LSQGKERSSSPTISSCNIDGRSLSILDKQSRTKAVHSANKIDPTDKHTSSDAREGFSRWPATNPYGLPTRNIQNCRDFDSEPDSGKDTDCASRRCAMQRPKRFASFQGGQRPTPMGFLPETMGKTGDCETLSSFAQCVVAWAAAAASHSCLIQNCRDFDSEPDSGKDTDCAPLWASYPKQWARPVTARHCPLLPSALCSQTFSGVASHCFG
jgi:hypothetical protein